MTPESGSPAQKRKNVLRTLGRLLITEKEWQKIRKPVISSFLLFHGMLNFCFMFNNHPFMFELNRFFHTYYLFLGLDQNFAVFAPVPRQRNPHLTALVHYKDGTTLLWNAPRMERLGFLEKIPAERYRKFYDDNTVWEHIPNFLPDIALYVARNSYFDRDNPPDTVSLIRYSSQIPPPPIPNPASPDPKMRNPEWLQNPPHSDTKLLLVIKISEEDLRGVEPK